MITPEHCVAGLSAATSEAVIRALAGRLLASGNVLPSFEKAALARERRSPTGLPFPGCAIALPHAEPEHVASGAIAVATLAAPVRFRQMGAPAIQLEVRIVVMPALSSREQASAQLSRLIELLQDATLRDALLAARDGDELARLLSPRWDAATRGGA
jgi:PTS system galactitol-specific IIA component